MRQRQIAICCTEKMYAQRFAEFAGKREDPLFAVHGFSDIGKLGAYLEDHNVEILLLSEKLAAEVQKDQGIVSHAGRIFLLTQEEYVEDAAYPLIYMLRPCRAILRQVEDEFAENSTSSPGHAVRTSGLKHLGVYSPVGRVGKTGFALALGKQLSKKVRTLYLNMEEYSGFAALYPHQGGTLSELMYFIRQGKVDFTTKLEAVAGKIGALDYIPPLRSPAEYADVRKEDWERLLSLIEDESRYDVLVIDLGCLPMGVFDLLESCDFIYTPVAEDEHARAKLLQYKETLRLLGMEGVLERSEFFSMPEGAALTRMIEEEGRRWSGA